MINAQSSWGLSLNQAEKFRRRLAIMQRGMKVGDWYEHTYWLKANIGEGHYECEMMRVAEIYPYHVSFEHINGRRESFIYSEIANDMHKVQNSSLLDWSDKSEESTLQRLL